MFRYYLNLALRSLKRSPILTALMVLAIGLGIGASMTMITVLHVMTSDPLPGRSTMLFTPHLDPLPLDHKHRGDGPDPTDNLTWPDAMALLKAHRAPRQAAMAGGTLLLRPARADLRPFKVSGRYGTAELFSLFDIPFEHGQGWSAADDASRSHVVVLSQTLDRKLFGNADGIGQTIRLGESDFRVIGVTADWRPQPMFYADLSAQSFGESDQFFLPLSAAVDLKLQVNGNQSGWGKGDSGDSLTGAEMTWLQFWVQLDSAAQVQAYHQFLIDYSARQKALGRFQRPATEAKLYSLMGWLEHKNLVPTDVRLQLWLALGFLCVCIVNIVALLLAKFLRRSGEISVRRALGARRRDIFLQLGVESATIGVAGGVLGLLIAELGLWSVRRRPDDYAQLAQMDMSMLLGTVALAVMASVLAGLLPAWRACRVQPALQLKTS
ncbi:MAG TPA: ABC transporter permease [Rhodanobacter sp.]|nr:ABC transporter permease [Rhodanobacter sp.]